MEPKPWKSEFIEMINFPSYIKSGHKNKTYDYRYLIAPALSFSEKENLFNKLDIPTDVINYTDGTIKVYYRYRTKDARMFYYNPNGKLFYKICGPFTKERYNFTSFHLPATKLYFNRNLNSPVIMNDEKEITYLPAISVYFQSGNLSYIAYIKDGYKYFSPGGQCLLPARIWYYKDGSIQREEYWDEGDYLEQFTVTQD